MARRVGISKVNDLDRLTILRKQLREFVAERDWAKFHNSKNLAMAIASEAGELLAHFRWLSPNDADELVLSSAGREKVANEIADIAIMLLLFCDLASIDLLQAIEAKLEINRNNYPLPLSRGKPDRA